MIPIKKNGYNIVISFVDLCVMGFMNRVAVFSDEMSFYLNGYVNSQKSDENWIGVMKIPKHILYNEKQLQL